MKKLYVVWDVVAMAIASSVLVYSGDPAAIRGFTDALQDPQGPYMRHPADFELWLICELEEMKDGPRVFVNLKSAEFAVTPEIRKVVLTGAQWVAMQAKQPELVKEA